MRPAEAVALQNDWTRRYNDPNGVLAGYTQSVLASAWAVKDGDEADRLAPRVVQTIAEAFRLGETFMVTADMTDLVEFASSRLDETDKVDIDMVPAKWGVVRFDRPLVMTDLRGLEVRAHWMTWSPSVQMVTTAFGRDVERKGIIVSWWNDAADPDEVMRRINADARKRKITTQMGRWAFIGADHIGDGMRLGPATRLITSEDLAAAAALAEEGEEIAPVDPDAQVQNTIRWTWALMLLLDQEIVTTRRAEYSRADRKTLGRMPVWNEVHVVELRRRSVQRHEGQPGTVSWTHRWIVRGHWRWQPYGDGSRRRIWIHPHIRGPEHLPFVQTKTVHRLSR